MYIHVLVQTTFDVRTTVSSPHSDLDHGPKTCYMHLEDHQLTQSPMILEKEETSPVLSSLTAAVLSVRESIFCSFIV